MSSSVGHLEDPPSSSVPDDETIAADSTTEVDLPTSAEPTSTATDDANPPVPASSSHPVEGPSAVEHASMPVSQPTAEAEVDFSRLDIDAEQLVASLFGDDDSSVSFEQPPTDNKKGFVPADHEDAAKWFYQDPQGVIQGEVLYVARMYGYVIRLLSDTVPL